MSNVRTILHGHRELLRLLRANAIPRVRDIRVRQRIVSRTEINYVLNRIFENGSLFDVTLIPDLVKLCMSSAFDYRARVIVCSFFYLNGVSEILCAEAVSAFRQRDPVFVQVKVTELYNYWRQDINGLDSRARYYSYDIIRRIYTYLNGVPYHSRGPRTTTGRRVPRNICG